MYRNLVCLLSLIFCFGCGNGNDKSSSDKAIQTLPPTGENLSPTWDTTLIVGEAIVWRFSETEESLKWDSVQVTNVFGFTKAPGIGALAQIVPMTSDLPMLYLKIRKIVPRDDFDEGSPQWYEVYFEDIKNQAYIDFKGPDDRRDETPMDLVVVYPPVQNVSYLKSDLIGAPDLPEGVNLNIIKAALDLDNDGKPDALVLEFCCHDTDTRGNCDLTCGETYIRYQGKWHLVDSSSPA